MAENKMKSEHERILALEATMTQVTKDLSLIKQTLESISPSLFAAQDASVSEIRREWDARCDVANFNILDIFPAKTVELTVTNKGVCPFTLTFTKDDGATQSFGPIMPGTPSTIERSNIKLITVDCDGTVAADRCQASYTLIKK